MKHHGQIRDKPQEETQENLSESLYDVVKIPVKHLSSIWSYVFPFLESSLVVNPLMNMDQIVEGLADESLQLWVVIRNTQGAELIAVFLTAIERDRGEWVLSLHNLVGREAKGWVMQCHEEAHRFARLQDCTRVRMFGRKAWSRILPDYEITGGKDGHFIYEKAVS